MRRVTADTNVLVSALIYRRGKPYQLLRMALEGEINLAISQPIIDETLDRVRPNPCAHPLRDPISCHTSPRGTRFNCIPKAKFEGHARKGVAGLIF